MAYCAAHAKEASKNPDGAGLTRRVCVICCAGTDDLRSRPSSTILLGDMERLLRSGGSGDDLPEDFGLRKEFFSFGSGFECGGRVSAKRELERRRVLSVCFRIEVVLEIGCHIWHRVFLFAQIDDVGFVGDEGWSRPKS